MLGKQLRDVRNELDLTLDEAAKVVGYPKTSLWRYEQQEGKVSVDTFIHIATKYGYSAKDLLDDKRLKALEQTDFDQIGLVVEHIQSIIQRSQLNPSPAKVQLAVTEVLKLETNRLRENGGTELKLDQYDSVIAGLLND